MSIELHAPTAIECKPWVRVVDVESWREQPDALQEAIEQQGVDWRETPLVVFRSGDQSHPGEVALRNLVKICSPHKTEIIHPAELSNKLSLTPLGSGKFKERKRPDHGWHTENMATHRVAGVIALTSMHKPGDSYTDFFNAAGLYSTFRKEEKKLLLATTATYRFGYLFSQANPDDQIVRNQYASSPMYVRPLVATDPRTDVPSILFAEPHFLGADRYGEDVTDQVSALTGAPDEHPNLHYRHSWEGPEVLVWRNLALWHRAVESDGIRSVLTARTLLSKESSDSLLHHVSLP